MTVDIDKLLHGEYVGTYTTANTDTSGDVTIESLRSAMRKMPPRPDCDLVVMDRAMYGKLELRLNVKCPPSFMGSFHGIKLHVLDTERDARAVAAVARVQGLKVLLCTAAATPRGEEGR